VLRILARRFSAVLLLFGESLNLEQVFSTAGTREPDSAIANEIGSSVKAEEVASLFGTTVASALR
jgi:hypothetical protein